MRNSFRSRHPFVRSPLSRTAQMVASACAVLALGTTACSDDADRTKTAADTASTDTASADTSTTPPTCDVDAPGCIEQSRYVADLTTIAVPRYHGSAGWKAAQDLCSARFKELGYTVTHEPTATGVNVVGRKTGTKVADEWVVLGAHVDAVMNCPGADDNASGVAGLLEAARALAASSHERSLMVACFDEEELGLLGSQGLATDLALAKTKIALAVSLEMIGYKSSEPNTQTLPVGFDALFTAVA